MQPLNPPPLFQSPDLANEVRAVEAAESTAPDSTSTSTSHLPTSTHTGIGRGRKKGATYKGQPKQLKVKIAPEHYSPATDYLGLTHDEISHLHSTADSLFGKPLLLVCLTADNLKARAAINAGRIAIGKKISESSNIEVARTNLVLQACSPLRSRQEFREAQEAVKVALKREESIPIPAWVVGTLPQGLIPDVNNPSVLYLKGRKDLHVVDAPSDYHASPASLAMPATTVTAGAATPISVPSPSKKRKAAGVADQEQESGRKALGQGPKKVKLWQPHSREAQHGFSPEAVATHPFSGSDKASEAVLDYIGKSQLGRGAEMDYDPSTRTRISETLIDPVIERSHHRPAILMAGSMPEDNGTHFADKSDMEQSEEETRAYLRSKIIPRTRRK